MSCNLVLQQHVCVLFPHDVDEWQIMASLWNQYEAKGQPHACIPDDAAMRR